MYSFKDFDIKPKVSTFTGDKIQVKKLLNLSIRVLDFKIEPSKQKEKRVVFTGSKVLADQIRQVPKDKFPFTTTIKGDNDYFEFT